MPLNAEVSFNDDGHTYVWLPDLPISADGQDFDTAVVNLVAALRTYAQTWVEDLHNWPNHADNWGLVNLVLLSDDEQLISHITG